MVQPSTIAPTHPLTQQDFLCNSRFGRLFNVLPSRIEESIFIQCNSWELMLYFFIGFAVLDWVTPIWYKKAPYHPPTHWWHPERLLVQFSFQLVIHSAAKRIWEQNAPLTKILSNFASFSLCPYEKCLELELDNAMETQKILDESNLIVCNISDKIIACLWPTI